MIKIKQSAHNGCKYVAGAFRRARQDRRGGIAIISALMLPVLVAAVGLVFDAGYYRWRERVLQSASDAAAMAAGQDIASGLVSTTQMFYAANEEAVRNGFMDGNFGWNGGLGVVTSNSKGSIQVNSPPLQNATYKGQTGYVEVILTENRSRMFSSLWQGPGIQPIVSASVVSTAGSVSPAPTYAGNGSGCTLLLDPTNKFVLSMYMTYSSQVITALSPGCEMIINSSGSANGGGAMVVSVGATPTYSSTIHFGGLLTVNQWFYTQMIGYGGNGSLNMASDYGPTNPRNADGNNPEYMSCSVSPCGTPPSWYGPAQPIDAAPGNADPYINTITPSGPLGSGNTSACIDVGGVALNVTTGVVNLPSGHYCKGFNISGGVVNLSPGITVVDTQFTMTGGTLNGLNGTTLVLGNGFPVQFTNAHLNLKAPVTGVTAGIALTEYADSPLTARTGRIGTAAMFDYGLDPTYNTVPGAATFTSGTLNFTGAIYLPRRTFGVGNSMVASSYGGTSGCGHIISYDLVLMADLVQGNICAGVGVLPFGSLSTTWGTAMCQTVAGALDPNCKAPVGAITPAPAASSNVKFVQ